jgi:hypothetical protein
MNISPKQHYLLHYPRCIREFGAPLWYSTMSFERMHQYFKNVQKSIHNTINTTKSLSYRVQELHAYNLMSNNIVEETTFGSKHNNSGYVSFCKTKKRTNDIKLFKWIIHNHTRYTIGDFVIKKSENNEPLFSDFYCHPITKY